MVSAPMLELYDGNVDTQVEVHIDASTKALGAILLQKYKLPNAFTLQCIKVRNSTMYNRITQLYITKCWQLWKLYSIGTYIVRAQIDCDNIAQLQACGEYPTEYSITE